ncbi:hypothetical protein CDD83_1360 [Cordyceps sp. RAO-2017]|nr:hypothetical protein CDD83_1360 [Cordyceps sp. RAO-2017]
MRAAPDDDDGPLASRLTAAMLARTEKHEDTRRARGPGGSASLRTLQLGRALSPSTMLVRGRCESGSWSGEARPSPSLSAHATEQHNMYPLTLNRRCRRARGEDLGGGDQLQAEGRRRLDVEFADQVFMPGEMAHPLSVWRRELDTADLRCREKATPEARLHVDAPGAERGEDAPAGDAETGAKNRRAILRQPPAPQNGGRATPSKTAWASTSAAEAEAESARARGLAAGMSALGRAAADSRGLTWTRPAVIKADAARLRGGQWRRHGRWPAGSRSPRRRLARLSGPG